MTGRDRDDEERFADLVEDAVPLRDRDRTRPAPARRPRAAASDDACPAARFLRDTGAGSGRAADAARRFVSLLRAGRYEVAREIDLHGLRREAARHALGRGLEAAVAAQQRCVRVIHGAGRHSPEEPVLRGAVPDWIESSRAAERIIAYAPAPRDLGGEGATLVLLRRSRGASGGTRGGDAVS